MRLRKDERRPFYERVQEENEHIIDTLKTIVSTWTENEIEDGYTPTYERFIDKFPEWHHDELIATISEEMTRVRKLCEISGPSQELQGA